MLCPNPVSNGRTKGVIRPHTAAAGHAAPLKSDFYSLEIEGVIESEEARGTELKSFSCRKVRRSDEERDDRREDERAARGKGTESRRDLRETSRADPSFFP